MLDLLSLPLVFGISVTAAITDIRTGKIPNRLIRWGLILGGCWTLALAVWLLAGGGGRSSAMHALGAERYLGAVILNGVLIFAISLLLWVVGVWAAGDAKLFSLLAFLLPFGFYENNYLQVLPSFVLFFNTFICLMTLLAVELLVRVALRVRGGALRNLPRWIQTAWQRLRAHGFGIVKIVTGFVAIFMLIRVLRHFSRQLLDSVIPLNPTLLYVILFLMFWPLIRLFSRPRVFAAACGAIVLYAIYAFFLSDEPALRAAIISFGWKSISIVFLAYLYIKYTDFAETRKITAGDVRAGMLLAPDCLQALQDNSEFNNERMGVQGPDGLTAEQVETLQTWCLKNHPQGLEAPLERSTTVPFAPAMLLALIATVVLRGYIWELS